jgi:hypothetical protein
MSKARSPFLSDRSAFAAPPAQGAFVTSLPASVAVTCSEPRPCGEPGCATCTEFSPVNPASGGAPALLLAGCEDSALERNYVGGDREAQFVNIFEKEAEIALEFAGRSLEPLRRASLLSINAKTTVSLDFPVGHTCYPTRLCAATCYASAPGAPTVWPKSLRKRLRNLLYIQVEDTNRVVEHLSREFAGKRRSWKKRGVTLDFLRVNSTGDLFPAVVPVLNGFAECNPDVRVWIVTRRFDLAALIAPLPNVYLQLSLDATTQPLGEEAARRVVASNPRAYLSFLRTEPNDDTRSAAIVFNATDDLPYNGRSDCPVDAGKLQMGNEPGVGGTACSKCRKCFTEDTLARQRSTLNTWPVEPSTRLDQLVRTDRQGRRHLNLSPAAEYVEPPRLP